MWHTLCFKGDFNGEQRTVSIGFAVLICKLRHESIGTLRLKSKHPLAAPLIDPQYLSHQEDVDSYVQSMILACLSVKNINLK